jgi:hypothetical protein
MFLNLLPLDRYAACCANLELVVTRIAVPGARSAPKRHWQPAKDSVGYQGTEPLGWLQCCSSRVGRGAKLHCTPARCFTHPVSAPSSRSSLAASIGT